MYNAANSTLNRPGGGITSSGRLFVAALAVLALLMVAALSSGCSVDTDRPHDDSTWHVGGTDDTGTPDSESPRKPDAPPSLNP